MKNYAALPVYTTEINVFEILVGLNLINSDHDILEQKLSALLETINVLALDRKGIAASAKVAAELIKKGKRIESTDCLIAGIAISNEITKILTANHTHFEQIPGLEAISY